MSKEQLAGLERELRTRMTGPPMPKPVYGAELLDWADKLAAILATLPEPGVVLSAGSRAVATELLRCFESWEPGVRVMGDVQAKDGADLMRAVLAQQPASDGGFTAADMMDARQEGRKEAEARAERLAEALKDLEVCANTVDRCYTHNPGNFAVALRELRESAGRSRDALRDHDQEVGNG